MIKCKITYQGVGWLVEFEDGKNIFLQNDTDICSFGVNCGLIPAPKNWDGNPGSLEIDYAEYDLEEIKECPEEYYYDIAE